MLFGILCFSFLFSLSFANFETGDCEKIKNYLDANNYNITYTNIYTGDYTPEQYADEYYYLSDEFYSMEYYSVCESSNNIIYYL